MSTEKNPRPVPRITLTPPEAADALGVSVDFFDRHIAPEVKVIYRGRKRLFPVADLERWANESSDFTLPARDR